jgi:two-component system sensor histidine kinase AlgZ
MGRRIGALAIALALALGVTAAVTEGAWWLSDYSNRMLGLESTLTGADHLRLLLRNVAVCAISAGLALRYFYVTHQWRSNVEAEAQSRVRALQARIRPHFLFNSMNTIASLTRTNPRVAEQAIADLSDLFRASLREHRERIPLASEIEIARAYERVERLRLGERLHVEWQIDGLPLDAQVPALILQPLLENAVYHGIEPLDKGGTIRVTGKREGSKAVLTIDNPVTPRIVARRTGHQIGLDNVRQRLELMFPGDARVEVFEAPERFVVTLRFPASARAA